MTTATAGADETARPRRVWTIDAVRELGSTTDVATAGAIFGIGRSKSYQLAKSGEFPVHLLRIGRRYRVPVPSILDLLGADVSSASGL
ncbi:DNA-binding protein [Catenuloplanes sp. NPDC051500]|uniref:DNA-binding protein n=1 Tax=Catenuloplanes sp. NPDC051500 TaxID=3363959 RepID=UPI0037B1D064